MRVVKTNLESNIIRAQRAVTQHLPGLVDAGGSQVFFKGLAGALAEYCAKMAGTEIYLGSHFVEG